MKNLSYIFLILFHMSISNSKAQELGISLAKLWTDNSEIQNPYGFSITVFQPILKLGLKAEYVSAINKRNYYGFLISGFMIYPSEVYPENVVSKSSYRAFELSLIVPKIIKHKLFVFNLGVGITFDSFKGERQGLHSGKKANLYEEHKMGIFYAISISRDGLLELPIKIELLLKHKSLMGGTYTTDIEQPFGGSVDIKELQFNLSYVF